MDLDHIHDIRALAASGLPRQLPVDRRRLDLDGAATDVAVVLARAVVRRRLRHGMERYAEGLRPRRLAQSHDPHLDAGSGERGLDEAHTAGAVVRHHVLPQRRGSAPQSGGCAQERLEGRALDTEGWARPPRPTGREDRRPPNGAVAEVGAHLPQPQPPRAATKLLLGAGVSGRKLCDKQHEPHPSCRHAVAEGLPRCPDHVAHAVLDRQHMELHHRHLGPRVCPARCRHKRPWVEPLRHVNADALRPEQERQRVDGEHSLLLEGV
mmetsp:Transcript_56247/g.163068  ORF Transcript_56247/g.163068 Transcript_56247/m.163068 type:complete len:266 (-) Transcript_56247:1059-1856(-)